MIRIALLPGDGVGPEVLRGPSELIRALGQAGYPIEATGPWPVGATAARDHGDVLPAATVDACEDADCILFGAVGDHPGIDVARPELALIRLRHHFQLGLSIRQVWRQGESPLVFVRNLIGGAYIDDEHRTESTGAGPAVDPVTLDEALVRDVVQAGLRVRTAIQASEMFSVDKANLLATSRLWRRVVTAELDGLEVPVRHVLVDRFAFELAQDRVTSGIVLTEGLFGDILSDLAAARAGSIAMCSSASINPRPTRRMIGLFEPVHGSAPRLTGRDMANPTGAYLALAAAVEWSQRLSPAAGAIRQALSQVMQSGANTYDMSSVAQDAVPTSVFAAAVNQRVLDILPAG
jgi:3-isopropylmalate dehydrogenase